MGRPDPAFMPLLELKGEERRRGERAAAPEWRSPDTTSPPPDLASPLVSPEAER
jgi:hypothetical protein